MSLRGEAEAISFFAHEAIRDSRSNRLSLKVYNTLTRKKENFVPLRNKEVRMYVCGVTLYDELHLGHARAAVVFDVISRYLEHKGYKVNYVTNFTDVDDKMIDRAKLLGISIFNLAEKFIGEYFEQIEALGVKKADCYPRATEHIKEIIDLIRQLENRGLAYCNDGNVFFRIKKFSSYGKLSGQKMEEILAGARIKVNEKKEDPLDFALWKKAKENEPFWDSPWGKGRPGWHIECSAMAMKYLGENLDIHGGGKDLIFPHHENEIAQSEGATGKQFVKYWLHNGLVTMKNAKMAKSTGNVFTLGKALEKYGGEAIRYFLLSAHYRNPLDYNENSLEEATSSLERIYTTLRKIKELKEEKKRQEKEHRQQGNLLKEKLESTSSSETQTQTKAKISGLSQDLEQINDLSQYLNGIEEKFIQALDDDFNTPVALSLIFEVVKKANLLLSEEYIEEEVSHIDTPSLEILSKTYQKVKALGSILGLFQKEEKKKLEGKEKELIEILIAVRNKLREKKDWTLADEIRKKLNKLGIELEDKRDKTVWRN